MALSEAKHVAITLLLEGRRYSEVADALQMDVSTLYVWRHDAEFAETLQRRQREMWEAIKAKLFSYAEQALQGMWDLACNPEAPWPVRQRAYADVLDRAGIVRPKDAGPPDAPDEDDLEGDLAELQRTAAKVKVIA